MDKLKQWVALTVVGVFAVLAAGWFLVVSPKRSDAASLRTDAESQQRANSGLQMQLAQLKARAKDLPRKQAVLAAVAAKIPDNPALPSLIRALTKAADDAGVELVSLSPSTPTPVTAAAPTTQVPVQLSSSSSSAPTHLAAPAASAGTLNQIPLAINVVGGYFQVEQFFDRLESLPRALKVTGFSLAPGTDPTKPASANGATTGNPGKTLTSQVTAMVYMSSDRPTLPTTPVTGK